MSAARAVADDGGAVIAALHDLNLAAAYADTVVLLFGGTLVAAGPPHRVLQPGLLTDVFGYPVVVAEGPTGAPLVVPAR
jgi:iron complex transport system ATP-binding protein